MGEFKLVKIDDIEAIAFGTFRRARAALGVSSFGLQVLDLPPNLEQYPAHDHAEDGQEEVYVVVRGSGEIELDGERYPIDPETMISIQPGTTRKLWPGPDGMRVVAIGGKAGTVFEPKELTELGAPDPFGAPAA
jgi:mannose-6-phosphate isomerase-like protein (cupin superfamily)